MTDIIVCRHVRSREITPQVLMAAENGNIEYAVCFRCADAISAGDLASALVTHCGFVCREHATEMGVPDKMPGPAEFYSFNSDEQIWVDSTEPATV